MQTKKDVYKRQLGVQAAGISGMDGGMLKVEKKYVDGRDIGYVGDIKSVDTKILHDLMEQDFLPIVYPIGMDDNGDAYNINADAVSYTHLTKYRYGEFSR